MTGAPDGTSAICKVGLDTGGKVKYVVCEVSLPGGLKEILAELPRIWL
jgi:hypothetical protein